MLQIIIALATLLLFSILSIIYVILKLRKCKNNFEEIFYHEYVTEDQSLHDNTKIKKITQGEPLK